MAQGPPWSTGPGSETVPSRLGPGEVRVTVLDLGRVPPPPDLAGLLSDEERRRASRLRRPDARHGYVASRALARLVVAAHTGLDPTELVWRRDCPRCGHPSHGRPRLAAVPAWGPVELSLARTAGLVAVAASRSPVGIDVERLGPPLSGLDRVLSPSERAELYRLAADDRRRAAYRAWVAKEAVGKVRGSGLIGVRELAAAPATAGAWRPVPDGEHTWQVRLVDPGPLHVAAVATAAGAASVEVLTAAGWPGPFR